MKILVLYYSLEGHTEKIAQVIQQQLDADIIKIQPSEEISKKGLQKFFWGGKSVFFQEKPTLLNNFPEFSQYDRIFIGTPIWSSNLTPPILALVDRFKFENQNICIFSSFMGSGSERTFDLFRKHLPKANIIATHAFKESEFSSESIQSWLKEIE